MRLHEAMVEAINNGKKFKHPRWAKDIYVYFNELSKKLLYNNGNPFPYNLNEEQAASSEFIIIASKLSDLKPGDIFERKESTGVKFVLLSLTPGLKVIRDNVQYKYIYQQLGRFDVYGSDTDDEIFIKD